eukprot:9214213-Alexandrium_andersonii.AAC.1
MSLDRVGLPSQGRTRCGRFVDFCTRAGGSFLGWGPTSMRDTCARLKSLAWHGDGREETERARPTAGGMVTP